MVRHYHQLGLMPQPPRSAGNYRLYSEQDVQRLKRIVALKQQGFQLSHIRKLLDVEPISERDSLITQLQQQYRAVIHQISQLRQTAVALERLLGRDQSCQIVQANALSQLKQLEIDTYQSRDDLDKLWNSLDGEVHAHPEMFQEALQRLLPDLSDRSEIEAELLSQLVLAGGDVSLIQFVRLSRSPAQNAIGAARTALQQGCPIVTDTAMIAAMLDQTRLAHLGCSVEALINNPHIHSASEAEQEFWHSTSLRQRVNQLPQGCLLVVGYAPSVLLAICDAINQSTLQPSLVIGMPIGFSHAPSAKRRLMQSSVPFITLEGTMGGGLLAATTLNTLVASLLEKPHCHCYLQSEQRHQHQG
jgi:precorrin-8X/cobalt-precorrin-8 methylmutase